jgi:hypothetical protein
MLQQSPSRDRPMQIVVIDHSFRHRVGWAERFAERMSDCQVILVTDKAASRKSGNLEVINVHDVTQRLELEALQQKFDFPIYRSLVAERAYLDYCTFTKSACYSRLDLDEIGKLIRPHVNALDEVIRTRADLVIGHLADNVVYSLAAHIAEFHGVPYIAPFPGYWWTDGYLFFDRADQTSSQVDQLYRRFYADTASIDREALDHVYKAKRTNFIYPDTIRYPFSARVKKILGSRDWHDPFSPVNWVRRRCAHILSRIMKATFTRRLPNVPQGQRYVLFPMHVAPEAAMLGSMPELADQFSLIKNISMNLPWGVRLCVKDHPEQSQWMGPRYDFYRQLAALKNVDIIAAGAPIKQILADPNCLAIAVINGTLGLEAGFTRKPVFVFGRAIYGVADCFLKPRDFDQFRTMMLAISKGEFQFDEAAFLAILAALNGAVWRGDNDFALAETIEQMAMRAFSAIENYVRSGVWRNADPVS